MSILHVLVGRVETDVLNDCLHLLIEFLKKMVALRSNCKNGCEQVLLILTVGTYTNC